MIQTSADLSAMYNTGVESLLQLQTATAVWLEQVSTNAHFSEGLGH